MSSKHRAMSQVLTSLSPQLSAISSPSVRYLAFHLWRYFPFKMPTFLQIANPWRRFAYWDSLLQTLLGKREGKMVMHFNPILTHPVLSTLFHISSVHSILPHSKSVH
jgi:hypothetical protein